MFPAFAHLAYLHPAAALASAVSFVQALEAKVVAEKAAREKRLAEARKRDAERRQEADRLKLFRSIFR